MKIKTPNRQRQFLKAIGAVAFCALVVILNPQNAYACTNPTGAAGDQFYNTDFNVMQYCDGTDWTAMRGGGSPLFIDNTTHITRENFHILDAGLAAGSTTAGLDGNGNYSFYDPDKRALRMGTISGGNDAWEDANIGTGSLTIGENNEASGAGSLAIGNANTASGDQSFAQGFFSTASGDSSVSMGLFATASGVNSIAVGQATTASGDRSFAQGISNIVSGDNSVSFGQDNRSGGLNSSSLGSNVTANGYHSLALGSDARAGDNTEQSNDATADKGNYSIAFGLGDSTGAIPQVTGNESIAIFFGDQNGEDITATNVLALEGGSLLLSNDSGTACAANKEGALRLNSTGDGFEICDGTSTWIDDFIIGEPTLASHATTKNYVDTAVSDRRLKKAITLMDDYGLDTIMALRPVNYLWKNPTDQVQQGKQFGFIAQEIEDVIPELIVTKDDAMETVTYKHRELVPILTKAIQELKAENDNLKERLDRLEAKMAE